MAEHTKDSASGGGGTFYGSVTAGRDVAGRDITSTNLTHSPDQLDALLEPIRTVLASVDEGRRTAARGILQQIEEQAAKGKSADDTLLSKLVEGFVGLIPEGVGAVVSAFGSPLLGAIAGPATRRILDRFKS
jgi:hypothetical protein